MKRAIQGGIDGVENAVEIVVELGIPEPENAVALGLEPAGPGFVPGGHVVPAVVPAVEFDRKPRLETAEIRHVGADRNLPTKMAAEERNIIERAPERLFRLGRIGAKPLGRRASKPVHPCHDLIGRGATPPRRCAPTLPLAGEGGPHQAATPPPSVFSQAAPQAFASSRTRRM